MKNAKRTRKLNDPHSAFQTTNAVILPVTTTDVNVLVTNHYPDLTHQRLTDTKAAYVGGLNSNMSLL